MRTTSKLHRPNQTPTKQTKLMGDHQLQHPGYSTTPVAGRLWAVPTRHRLHSRKRLHLNRGWLHLHKSFKIMRRIVLDQNGYEHIPPSHQKQCKFVNLTPLRSVRHKVCMSSRCGEISVPTSDLFEGMPGPLPNSTHAVPSYEGEGLWCWVVKNKSSIQFVKRH